jgi:UDP-2,3-diacylglucosamine pyrophosphatase LpxH
MPYWSLSAYMKKRVKNAVAFVSSYEEAVAQEAIGRGLDGVVCGHIHCAEIREFGGITYYNDGDWVESCTALAEDAQGHIAIIDWAGEKAAEAEAEAEQRGKQQAELTA